MNSEPTICLVGAGNMGGAMLNGWLEAGRSPASITVIDPNPPEPMAHVIEKFGVDLRSNADGVSIPDLIIVAVKPQIMNAVLDGIVELVSADNALLSVAAGTTLSQLAQPFAAVNPRIIRAMPNTPAQVQKGITVCVAGDGVTPGQCDQVSALLAAVGQVAWIDDENLMDAVTGVSGSGPAYVFHLAEALADAGVAAGLPVDLAAQLAQATVSGAGALMAQSDMPPGVLRENVTSPNGTTQAALNVLMGDGGFPDLLKRAVAAAATRSQELADG